MNKLL